MGDSCIQVEKILEQVYKAAEKNHNTASLFFDEMAAVIGSCTIHTEVLVSPSCACNTVMVSSSWRPIPCID